MVALIDFDLVLYRTACSTNELGIAISRVNDLLDHILQRTGSLTYKAWVSSPTNFRKTIYPEYKGNRTQERPALLDPLREYAIENLGVNVSKEGLETDDELCINQTEDTIICSLDKDLLQCEGRHFQWSIEGGPPDKRWVKQECFYNQTELEGNRLLYEQILKGDVNDNVKGCAGIGTKKAQKLIEPCTTEKEMIKVCLKQYNTEEEFLMNAQCIYLLRSYEDSYLSRYERVLNEL